MITFSVIFGNTLMSVMNLRAWGALQMDEDEMPSGQLPTKASYTAKAQG
jgi:hypothetical protein